MKRHTQSPQSFALGQFSLADFLLRQDDSLKFSPVAELSYDGMRHIAACIHWIDKSPFYGFIKFDMGHHKSIRAI